MQIYASRMFTPPIFCLDCTPPTNFKFLEISLGVLVVNNHGKRTNKEKLSKDFLTWQEFDPNVFYN